MSTDYETLKKLFEAALKEPERAPVRGNSSHHITRPGHAPQASVGNEVLRIRPAIRPNTQRPQGH
ncbi:MAG TPA: hypothetical protein VFY13_09940 [Luteolibacter sp.]|nr:hypothetical protein [Luteolibacter sp.]